MHVRSIAAMTVLSGTLAAGLLLASPAVLAQEATIHQVYEAAEAGKFIEAQKMMDQVLAAHPNSAKAHFIEAELLAKQGKMARAATELATAERLGPDGKFARPEALQRLKAVLATARPAAGQAVAPAGSGFPLTGARVAAPAPPALASAPAPAPGLPWGMLFGIGALVLLAVMFFKRKATAQAVGAGGMGGMGANNGYPGATPAYPQGGMPTQWGNGGAGVPAAPAGMGGAGGIGSGILGGLATGAALGAGMVAGQALAHRFTDGGQSGQSGHDGNRFADGGASGLTGGAFPDNRQVDTPPSGYDMGGNDFGVADSGSWDSGSDSGGGGGGSDWD